MYCSTASQKLLVRKGLINGDISIEWYSVLQNDRSETKKDLPNVAQQASYTDRDGSRTLVPCPGPAM